MRRLLSILSALAILAVLGTVFSLKIPISTTEADDASSYTASLQGGLEYHTQLWAEPEPSSTDWTRITSADCNIWAYEFSTLDCVNVSGAWVSNSVSFDRTDPMEISGMMRCNHTPGMENPGYFCSIGLAQLDDSGGIDNNYQQIAVRLRIQPGCGAGSTTHTVISNTVDYYNRSSAQDVCTQ